MNTVFESEAKSLGATEHDVVVVGAGPTGLLVAAELALAGLTVTIIERLTEPDKTIKAGSINVATAEVLDRRGLRAAAAAAQATLIEEVKIFAAKEGKALPSSLGAKKGAGTLFPAVGHFAGLFFRPELVNQNDSRIRAHTGAAGSVMVRQSKLEDLLSAHALHLGVQIRRGVEVRNVEPLCDASGSEEGIRLETNQGPLTVGWVVAADGGRSRIRHLMGISFPGTEAEITGYQAVAEMTGAQGLRPGWNYTPKGVYSYGPLPGRILTVQFTGVGDRNRREEPVSIAELQESIRSVTGEPVTVRSIVGRATRWSDNARQAETYRAGRILLAGDAAHVHSPFSGQGLNLGVGDAINLGWKLAATIRGWAPQGLLDTYTSERHPIGARVLDWTRAQVALMRGDEKTAQLRHVVEHHLMSSSTTMTEMLLVTSGLAQQYDLSCPASSHPLIGKIIGDTPLSNQRRLAEYFANGDFVLLDRLGGLLASTALPYGGRVLTIAESSAADTAPDLYRHLTGLLVRPDGIIAWATDSHDGPNAAADLADVLLHWAGAPSPGLTLKA